MKIKKKYSFKSKRQIWRVIPTETEKLIIEEREPEKKQVYFNCFEIETGKKIFKDFQLDEKFWVGIEAVYKDVIFFHKYLKPDMPAHKGIFAYDISNKNFLWENKDLTFLFPLNNLIYAYAQKFEGRNHFTLNYKTGEIVEDLGPDSTKINELRDESIEKESSKDYYFSNVYSEETIEDTDLNSFIKSFKEKNVISGRIEIIQINSILFFSFHVVNSKGSLDVLFKVVDLSDENYILEEVLVRETRFFMSDSFFIKGNLLFVLYGKNGLKVFELKM